MAESAISSVVQSLSNVLIQKAVIVKDVRAQVEWLHDELKSMQCFLEDADVKRDEDPVFKNWVSEIRGTAYDAEDIIDTFILKIESRKTGFLRRYACIFKELYDLYKVGKEIESLKVKLNDIYKRGDSYGIRRTSGEGTSSSARERLRQLRRSSPLGLDKDLVGLDDDTTQLVARLLQEEDRLTVISIVGIGGLGKTALAKKVYNHEDVKFHFSCRAWVYVSQECKPRDILQGIITEVTRPTKELLPIIESSNEQGLETMLYEHLEETRYLVVLDDIWSAEDWDVLARAFPSTNNGSKVLLTTRKRGVALHADARSVPHDLPLLNKGDSWELFSRKAFINEANMSCPPELEEVARQIVERCAGLPLAIVVIGGLLSSKCGVGEWKRVLSKIHSHFARGQTGVLAMLALSYSDLPYYLKPCFLYLGLFPEDFLISAQKLYILWIAEGLIPQGEGRMESIAEDYLNELKDRNMVQVAQAKANGRIKLCQIHDVLRDLSILKAREEIFLEIIGKRDPVPLKKTRHLAIYSHNSNVHWYFHLKSSIPHLRSLIFFGFSYPEISIFKNKFSQFICARFKLLRVLDLSDMLSGGVPSEIGQLINLRYLGLCRTETKTLPSSMKYLQNLQTLDLSGVIFSEIPNVISKMENLRHLYMGTTHVWLGTKVCTGQLRIECLRHLQTLFAVHVENWGENNSENLVSLRKLGVFVSSTSDVGKFFESIAKLEHLLSLYLYITGNYLPPLTGLSHLHGLTKLHIDEGQQTGMRMLSELHEFPPNITSLTLDGCYFDQCPMGTLKELPKLLILKLRAISYQGQPSIISADGFPQLWFLELVSRGMQTLIIERGAMPRLRHCRFMYCGELTISCSGSVLSALHEAEIEQTYLRIIEASPRVDISEFSPGVGDQ